MDRYKSVGLFDPYHARMPGWDSPCRDIGFLVFPGFDFSQLHGPLTAFKLACSTGGLHPLIISLDGGDVQSLSGQRVMTRPITADGLDTLVVIGSDAVRAIPRLSELADFVCAAAAMLRRIASIGTGAFVLAEAGLLTGRHAAIGADFLQAFKESYPAVLASSGRAFINDRGLWTAAGDSSGVELCLALIEEDWGALMRHLIAQELPADLQQEQHVLPAGKLSRAKQAERLMAETARRRVQDGNESFEAIARAAGFKDAESMRKRFLRFFGHPPQVLRRMARVACRAQKHRNITWPPALNIPEQALAGIRFSERK